MNIHTITNNLLHGGEKSTIKNIADKHCKYVNLFDNVNEYGRIRQYPYRLHVRAGGIKDEMALELEQAGFSIRKGQTCNEWETSIRLKKSRSIQKHPPHTPMKIKVPTELQKMAPNWTQFLEKLDYLGHLLGTLSNGIEVPKQAFGECETSIVLEVYKRAYGDEEYKNHQCDTCINYELSFKENVESHNASRFETSLNQFVNHFKTNHKDLFKKLGGMPSDEDYTRNYEDGWTPIDD